MTQRRVTVDEARRLAGEERGRRWGERRRHEKEEAASRRSRFRVAAEAVTVRLPYPPALNRYWRTTVFHGQATTYISAAGKQYRKMVIEEWRRVGVTFDGLLAVQIDAVFPDARKRDLDGIPKGLLDALEHAGAFASDWQIKWLLVRAVATQAPGWVTVTVGPKPGERQGNLFTTEW